MAQAPLYELKKTYTGAVWNGTDFMYVVTAAEARAAIGNGYELQRVISTAYDSPGDGLVEFQRYTVNDFHFYTTDPTKERLSGWTKITTGTPIYVHDPKKPAPEGTVLLERYLSTGQNGVGHFYTRDTTTNPPPEGWVSEGTLRTGFVGGGTEVTFEVTYNMSQAPSGITVSGGNAVGTTVTIGTDRITLDATDALIAYGAGNWIRFEKDDSNAWHFDRMEVAPADPSTPASSARFETFLSVNEHELDLVDEDFDETSDPIAYKYTLYLNHDHDDGAVRFDPKIINRTASGSIPNGGGSSGV